jgi:pimeloyl-ACP methyl ester carboxylesterase
VEDVLGVGHSFGGRALLMAKRLAPHRLRSIALLDIAPSPIPPERPTTRALDALRSAPDRAESRDVFRSHLRSRGLDAALIEWLLMNVARDDRGFTWRIDRERLAALDRRASPEDLWDTIDDTITCIRGGASPYVSDADADRLRLAGAAVHTIEGAGHLVHVEAVDAVLDLLGR